MLTVHKGYDVGYLTGAVGGGGADYYLSAVGDGGEPPGVWTGRGAEVLGLSGQVKDDVMRNLYHRSVAPDGTVVGRPPRSFKTMNDDLTERIAEAVAAEGPFVTRERVSELTNIIKGQMRNPVAFFDFTFSAAK